MQDENAKSKLIPSLEQKMKVHRECADDLFEASPWLAYGLPI